MFTKTTLLVTSGLLLTALMGCSGSEQNAETAPPPPAAAEQQTSAPPPTAAERITEARALYNTSVELGFAWVAAGKQLDAAQKALEAGEEAAALAAADEAAALAEASISQAQTEAEAWQGRMPFNPPGN